MKAVLEIRDKVEAEQVASALIAFERSLRRHSNALGVGPWSRLADNVRACRRTLQEAAGLVTLITSAKKSVTYNQQLAYAVKRLRKHYQFSQAELAKRAGVHMRTLQAVEAGRRNSLTLAGALALSRELGGNIHYCIVPK